MQLRDVIEAMREPIADTVSTLLDRWECYRRTTQRRPAAAKRVTYFQAGRGWGKNYVTSNTACDIAEDLGPEMLGLLASRTGDETIEVDVRGVSGILAAARRRGYEIEFVASRGTFGTLVHPSGAEIRLGSGDVADGCRGPNLTHAILQEVASWKAGAEAFGNVNFATRRKCPGGPFIIVGGTPHYNSRIRFDPDTTTIVTGTMDENVDNLDPETVASLRRQYAGSKLGRQELLGEVVSVEGATVDLDVIHRSRVRTAPELERVAIGVDPSVAARIDRDAIGVIVVGIDRDQHVYVLQDASIPGTRIDAWARHVIGLYRYHAAGSIVVEVNQGGDSNVFALEQAAMPGTASIVPVHARGSKRDRAERVLGVLYSQARIHHVGEFEDLERELTTWTGGGKSPDRMDALVHAVEYLVDDDSTQGPIWAYTRTDDTEDRPLPAPWADLMRIAGEQ